jgi:hypothetical protein
MVKSLILLALLVLSEGFTPSKTTLVRAVTHRYARWLPPIELTLYHSDIAGAYATCGVGDRADNCSVVLGRSVWSRSEAVSLGYPAYGRSDNEHARIVIGHELAHLTLTPEEEALYAEYLGISDADYAKEEAATVFSFKAQHIPLRLFESDVSRRASMHRWFSAVRRARFPH